MTATEDLIASTTLGSAATTITFSSVPSTYTNLRIVLRGACASQAFPVIRLNGDTGTNYIYLSLEAVGTSQYSYAGNSNDYAYLTGGTCEWNNSKISTLKIDVLGYKNTNTRTNILTQNSADQNQAGGGVSLTTNTWANTATVTTIELGARGVNFLTGTTASLYGLL